jgi:hypothetical protein
MSHPDSDGIGEMLEGGGRATSTGALQMVEMAQRRRQWAAHHLTREAHAATRDTDTQRQALADVATLTDTRYREWIATQRTNIHGPDPVDARLLFSHLERASAENAFTDLVDGGDHLAYLRAYREVLDHAARSPQRAEPGELHRRAAELFDDTQREQSAAGWAQTASDEAQELAGLRKLLALQGDDGLVDELQAASLDLIHLFPDPADPIATPSDGEAAIGRIDELHTRAAARVDESNGHSNGGRSDDATAELQHDSAQAREQRAARLMRQGFDSETTQAALIHDLSFGTAAAAVEARSPKPATKRWNASRHRRSVQQKALGR